EENNRNEGGKNMSKKNEIEDNRNRSKTEGVGKRQESSEEEYGQQEIKARERS
ncbi:14888_t:CDS:1, partial [Dentiscutata erythropus]